MADAQHWEYTERHWIVHFKMVKMVNLMLCQFYLNTMFKNSKPTTILSFPPLKVEASLLEIGLGARVKSALPWLPSVAPKVLLQKPGALRSQPETHCLELSAQNGLPFPGVS